MNLTTLLGRRKPSEHFGVDGPALEKPEKAGVTGPAVQHHRVPRAVPHRGPATDPIGGWPGVHPVRF